MSQEAFDRVSGELSETIRKLFEQGRTAPTFLLLYASIDVLASLTLSSFWSAFCRITRPSNQMMPPTRWPGAMTRSQHVYEVRPRKVCREVNLIFRALPFGRLW